MVMLACAVPYVAQVGEYGRLKAQLLAQEELQVCTVFRGCWLWQQHQQRSHQPRVMFAAYGLAAT